MALSKREKRMEKCSVCVCECVCVCVCVKQIISNWSADKEIDKIEKQMLELQKRKEDMSRNME